jgi:UDP-glucose 4-epimerase
LVFGVGMVGSSIINSMGQRDCNQILRKQSFQWNQSSYGFQQNIQEIYNEILILIKGLTRDGRSTSINIVWSAGKSRFSATNDQLENEIRSFDMVIRLACNLEKSPKVGPVSFRLISSAGGLFEGVRQADSQTPMNIQRPYGHFKKLMEDKCISSLGKGVVSIYRLSSLYGINSVGNGRGLIPILIQNAMDGRMSNIYGHLNTVRDYVYDADVGKLIGDDIYFERERSQPVFLASGKPSSIMDVLSLINRSTRKNLSVRFINMVNAKNMSISDYAIPIDFRRTQVSTGIKLMCQKINQTKELRAKLP